MDDINDSWYVAGCYWWFNSSIHASKKNKMNDNKIDYIEFPAKNIEILKNFYNSVFGWKFTDYGPNYSSFSDGRLSGGFTTDLVGESKLPLVVIYSKNIEKTKESIIKFGGEIIKDIFDFPGGKRFHFIDPDKNELAVWSN